MTWWFTDVSDWEAETLRITGFVAPEAIPEVPTWQDFTNGTPDRMVRDPKTSIVEEAGKWDDVWLVVRRQYKRIDLLIVPIPQELSDEGPAALQTIGKLDEKAELLKRMMTTLTNKFIGDISRIALGAVLLQAVDNEDAGNSVLSQYLKNLECINEPGITDLLYQVNRPRNEMINDTQYKLNRVSKWSVQSSAQIMLVVNNGIPQAVAGLPEILTKHARLEFDLSTDMNTTSYLPREHLDAMIVRLIQLGQEIASNGDVP